MQVYVSNIRAHTIAGSEAGDGGGCDSKLISGIGNYFLHVMCYFIVPLALRTWLSAYHS